MLGYNLLHARNELAHNNRVILQASGTLCVWVLYRNYSDLDEFLSINSSLALAHDLIINNLKLVKANSEELHQYLLKSNLHEVDILFLTFCAKVDPQLIDEFLGQEQTFSLLDQILVLPKHDLSFNLETPEGIKKWEAWLLANTASHEIEYYEPGMN